MNANVLRIALLLVAGFWPRLATCQPTVKFLFPAGGKTGCSVDVKLDGDLPNWPVHVWVDRPGLVAMPRSEQDKDKGKLVVDIASEAQPGLYWLRMYDDSGAAAPKPFVVGWLSEVMEQESNNATDEAQLLQQAAGDTQAVTVNGRLEKRGDVDVYAIHVAHGQTLIADIDSHLPLGSAVDTVLQILSPAGFVDFQIDDHHSLDPRAVYTVPHEGTWYLRVFGFPAKPTSSIQFAGDSAYVYRLTVSTGPFVDFTLPLAARDTGSTEFQLFGWNLAQVRSLTTQPEPGAERVFLRADGLTHSIHVPVVTDSLLLESEPCSESQPMPIKLPATITGQIQSRGDRDAYSFDLNRGRTVVATLESRTLGYPLDGVIELLDADGNQLARNDDSGGSRDAALNHRAGDDGSVRLVVSDLHRKGGENFVYRLRIAEAVPDFTLSTADHQINLQAGEKTELTVRIERSHGFDKTISVSAEGLPPGVSVAAVESIAEGESAKQIKLTFAVEPTAAASSSPVRIVGSDGESKKHATISVGSLVDLWVTVVPDGESQNPSQDPSGAS